MNILWTDERNRLSVEVIKVEIMTNFNYSLSYQEFCEWQKARKNTILKFKIAK